MRYVVALVLVLAAHQLVGLLPDIDSARLERLAGSLQTAELVVILVAVGLVTARWKMAGDAPALWLTAGLGMYGLALATTVLGLVWSEGVAATTVGLIPWAAKLTAAALLFRALLTPPVDSRTRPTYVAVPAVGIFACALTIAALLPASPPVGTAAVWWLSGAGGLLLAGASGIRAWREQSDLWAWCALMLLAFSLGSLAARHSPLAEQLLRLVGVVLLTEGAAKACLLAYRDTSMQLADTSASVRDIQQQLLDANCAAEERAHEALSALAAIEGATCALEQRSGPLQPDVERALSAGIRGEIRRLQALVAPAPQEEPVVAFSLAELLAPVVTTERARAMRVDLRVPGELSVLGRIDATAEVFRVLFDNARRYAPGTPVTVIARHEGNRIVATLRDAGPGLSAVEREAVFHRGVRGRAAFDVPGSGLGLAIAARLMKEQGGDLWADACETGASFSLSLPLVPGTFDVLGSDVLPPQTDAPAARNASNPGRRRTPYPRPVVGNLPVLHRR